jgi:predicted histidine transporter YuiF (NhaC family)
MSVTISLQLVLSACSLIGIGITIGYLRSIYLTKKEHEEICSKRQEDILDNRKEVWKKIDKIYEWMATGAIKVNRSQIIVDDDTKI